jgi:hypothetical protein
MKKLIITAEELDMIQALRNTKAQQQGTANANGNNGSNNNTTTSNLQGDERQKRRYQMQPVYRVIKKARMWFMRQMKKDTATKKQCLEAAVAALPELYPDTLRFELDFRKERERLIDSKRFNDACLALKLDPVNVADHVVFEGKGILEKVLKEGLQVLGEQVRMFNAPIWEDTESLYETEAQQKEVAND